MYLESLGLPYEIIDYYVSYHYGYMKDENGRNDYNKVLSTDEYKKIYQEQLDIFNNYINKTRIIIDMVNRFIIRGRNSEYDIDAFVSGTVDDYVWIMKDELYDLILSKRNVECNSPHIGCITLDPKKRNLDGTSNNIRDRYFVTARWNFIKNDILDFKNMKTM